MRTEHPGIEGGLCGFCPVFLNREHQTGDASAVPVEEGESQYSLPSVSSPSQTVTMSQLSLSPAAMSQRSPLLSPPSGVVAANAGALDAQVPVASAAVPMLQVPKKKADLLKMSPTDLKTMCDLNKVVCQPSGKKGFVKTDYVDALYNYANPGARPPVARSGGGSKNSASVVGEEGGGAKGKCTSKEWNQQQAKATQALKAEYFEIYMKQMLELKQAAGASWSKPGVTQQAQVDMESFYFNAYTHPRLRKLRDENAPPLSVDLTDMAGLALVEKEMVEERSDGDEDGAGADERE